MLSSGLLTPAEALELVRALRRSALYRADQHSYQLYPDRELPTFLARNLITAEQAASAPLLEALVAAGDTSIVLRDVRGEHRFAPGLHNARDLDAALDAANVPGVADGRRAVLDVFEQVFRHAEFTGRSGSFFAYEGLGSIYWHMVSKLLLAVQENHERAVAEGADADVVAGLADAYEDVRLGLGYCKTPDVYGAFPVDPYSHTPAGKGARQPGMTGQVKEEILTRLGELGLRVEGGRVVVRPVLLRADEWTTDPDDVHVPRRHPAGAEPRAPRRVARVHVLPGAGRLPAGRRTRCDADRRRAPRRRHPRRGCRRRARRRRQRAAVPAHGRRRPRGGRGPHG